MADHLPALREIRRHVDNAIDAQYAADRATTAADAGEREGLVRLSAEHRVEARNRAADVRFVVAAIRDACDQILTA